MVQFPQELIDMVIDHLHDNKPALSSCSLTCSNWLPSSRLHKFYSLTFSNFDSLSGCPAATDSIKNLCVGADYCTYRARLTLDALSIKAEYTNLHHLILRHVVIAGEDVTFLPAAFPQLRHFSISSSTVEDNNQLIRLLCQFPLLESLDLAVNLLRSDQPANSSSRMPPLNGSFSITENVAGAGHSTLEAMIASPLAIDFKSIKLDTIDSVFTINALLRKRAAAVEHVEIMNVDPWQTLDFAHNKKLRSLRLPVKSHMTIPSLHFLLQTLGTIDSPNLAELRIPLSSLHDDKWQELDRFLTQDPRFAGLQRLVLGFPKWVLEEKCSSVSINMPLTKQKVVVEVQSSADL